MTNYRVKATFKSGSQVAQDVTATDTREALIVFLSRTHMGQKVDSKDEDGMEEVLEKVEVINKYD